MPAIFELVEGAGLPDPADEAIDYDSDVEKLSVGVAVILLGTYVAGLLFSLRTHKDLFNPPHDEEDHVGEPWSVRKSVLMLAIAGVAVGLMSEILVGSISEASESIGLSPFFVGVIVVAIVGNAAEHWVAIYFAARDKMDLAVNIAIGSSAQIALFAAPGAGAAVVLHRRLPDGARVQRLRARGGRARGADRQPGHARGRVDLVRGPPAAGGLRGAGRSPSTSSDGCASARVLRRAAAVADPRRPDGRLPLGRPALLRARPRAELPRGPLVEHRLARRLAAGRGRRARARERRRRGHVHDRLLHRALAVARQPVRLPPAVLVLRRAGGAPRAAAVLGHRRRARAARRSRSSAASR